MVTCPDKNQIKDNVTKKTDNTFKCLNVSVILVVCFQKKISFRQVTGNWAAIKVVWLLILQLHVLKFQPIISLVEHSCSHFCLPLLSFVYTRVTESSAKHLSVFLVNRYHYEDFS